MRRGFLSVVGSQLTSLRNTTPVPYTANTTPRPMRGGGLWGLGNSSEAQMRAMGSNGMLFAVVDRIITSYSQVEWHLYRKAKSGHPEDREEVTSHAALDLWNQPNKFMTGPSFRETSQQHEELVGEQYWVAAKHERFNLPLELWPVRPDRMNPVPDPQAFLSGYQYTGPGGQVVDLRLDEVFFQRRPNPLDPYRGWGAVQTILTDLDSSRYSREWNRNFFLNNAEPGGILQVEKRLTDDEFDEHQARWNEQHRGISNGHRVALLENGITWQDRKYTARDMQFAELSEVSDEKIRGAFGFPRPMTGATDDINRANAEAGEVVFARWLILVRLRRTKAILNTQLLPMYGRLGAGLEFDFDNPVPADLEAEAAQLTARANAASLLRSAGWAPDDILSTVGLPEMRWIGGPAPAAPGQETTFEEQVAQLLSAATGDR
ncbi:phage portal protein [Actinacidiphila rubida]|uniref:Phage portal protein, HK97 family n=1 Tax=Actinacidiphila rubida TaxID=310780 RepID=A0A1H8SYG0_9ACTN|nr:phage portal protein [Actinacidiphila rubida]SEO83378.1 phage portal protein, HK97 family [Actinacidiphila rubida]